jgi:hypothetical protein
MGHLQFFVFFRPKKVQPFHLVPVIARATDERDL